MSVTTGIKVIIAWDHFSTFKDGLYTDLIAIKTLHIRLFPVQLMQNTDTNDDINKIESEYSSHSWLLVTPTSCGMQGMRPLQEISQHSPYSAERNVKLDPVNQRLYIHQKWDMEDPNPSLISTPNYEPILCFILCWEKHQHNSLYIYIAPSHRSVLWFYLKSKHGWHWGGVKLDPVVNGRLISSTPRLTWSD